jgi:hypothetical protein
MEATGKMDFMWTYPNILLISYFCFNPSSGSFPIPMKKRIGTRKEDKSLLVRSFLSE